jgi:hypothetical protein
MRLKKPTPNETWKENENPAVSGKEVNVLLIPVEYFQYTVFNIAPAITSKSTS